LGAWDVSIRTAATEGLVNAVCPGAAGCAQASPLRIKQIDTPGAALAAQANILARTFPPGRVIRPIHGSVGGL
jgi:hypothetical protein